MKYTYLILIALTLFSCKQKQAINNTANENASYFIIGQGGGFSGQYEQFKISSTGIIERFDANSQEYLGLRSLDKKEVKPLFDEIKQLGLYEYELDQRGNMTSYILLPAEKNQAENNIYWPMGEAEVDQGLQSFFDKAWAICKADQ